jgi:hypothetical protein
MVSGAVDGSLVYTAGVDSTGVAAVFRFPAGLNNHTPSTTTQLLPGTLYPDANKTATVKSVAVSNGSVVAGGNWSDNTDTVLYPQYACVWKDGVYHKLPVPATLAPVGHGQTVVAVTVAN